MRAAAEHRFQDGSGKPGHDRRLRRVFRMHRRGEKRPPPRVALSRVVAVDVTVADRRDGAPEVVMELGVPVGDEGVGDAHVEQRKHARAVRERQCFRNAKLARGVIPAGNGARVPEAHRLGLLRGARRAFGGAQGLRLVVVACIEGTGQWRRRPGPELISALHHPRLCLRILAERRRRGRYPHARRRDRAIGIWRVGGVVGAVGEDDCRGAFAHGDPLVPRGAIGNGVQRGGVGFLDPGFLTGVKLEQHVPRCARCGSFCRGARSTG